VKLVNGGQGLFAVHACMAQQNVFQDVQVAQEKAQGLCRLMNP